MRNANVLKGAKRLTAVLLALVMILGLVPQAFAAGQALHRDADVLAGGDSLRQFLRRKYPRGGLQRPLAL